jgi:hypothetical protein
MGSGSGGRRGCGRFAEPPPLPGQELVQAALRDRGDPRKDVGQPGLRVDVVEPGRYDEREHDGGTRGTAVRTGEQPCLSSKSQAAQCSFRRIVRQADPAILREAGEVAPALEQVIDRLDHGGGAREPGPLRVQPGLQVGEKRRAPLLADRQALGGAEAVDLALDLEQRIDAPDRLQRDRRDRRRRSPAPGVLGDIGQFEERPAGMAPAERGRDRLRLAPRVIERIEAAIGVGLQDAGEALQMLYRMLAPAIARGVVEGGGRRGPAERPVVVLPLARIGTVVSSPCSRSAARTWASIRR